MTLEIAREVLRAEMNAIKAVAECLGAGFETALDILCEGDGRRVVACGVGKAGIIARKAAATLSSTGTDAVFLHPSDALHGDLGRVREGDAALVFSNSGESDEISRLLPFLRRNGAAVIAVTASTRSTLGVAADAVVEMGDLAEACPLGLAPTASTTAMLALADALAVALMRRKGFSASEYARFHPAGELGRKAFTVGEVMRGEGATALLRSNVTVRDALPRISAARAGSCVVTDVDGKCLGVFTDGDLRRGLERDDRFLDRALGDAMTPTPHVVRADAPAVEAAAVMRERRIGEMPVVDENERVVGVVDMKSLLAEGVI